MQTLKSQWGSVKPYTRHLSTCPYSAGEEEYNRCSCPKWIYTNRRGIDRETNFPYQPARYTLNTPSWSEALEVATSTLKGFDPEIAKARAAEADKEAKQINVESAIRLWLDRTRNLVGEKSSTVNDHRSLLGWRDRKNRARGVMLKYVEQWNSEHPEETISCIQNITALWLQRWRPVRAERGLVTLIALLDADNYGYRSFYVLPGIDKTSEYQIKGESDPWLQSGERLSGLLDLYRVGTQMMTEPVQAS